MEDIEFGDIFKSAGALEIEIILGSDSSEEEEEIAVIPEKPEKQ